MERTPGPPRLHSSKPAAGNVTGAEPDGVERAAWLGIALLDRALGGNPRLTPGDVRGEALLSSAMRQLIRALSELDATSQHERLRIRVRESLAVALSSRPWRHDIADEEAARAHLEGLLADTAVEGDPAARQRIHHNLGVLYQNRVSGDSANNRELAVHHLEAALAIQAPDEDADQRATTISQLGNTYTQRLRGDRVDNVERALEYYRQALVLRTREGDPVRWGITQHNLGILYRARLIGDRQENIRHAIAALQEALTVRTRDDYPEYWAMTLRELGASQLELAEEGGTEAGARSLTGALEVYNRENAPLEWSLIQFELAGAAVKRGAEADAEVILEGLLAMEDLERDQPLLWARVAMQAGLVLSRRAADQHDEMLFRRALQLMEAGTRRLLAGGELSAGRAAAVDLGDHLLAIGQFGAAAQVYLAALQADAQQYAASLSLFSRGREVRESEGVAGRAALALVREGRPRRAVEVLERSRGRLLGDALARDRADLQTLLDGDTHSRTAAQRYTAAAQRVRDLEEEERQQRGDWTQPQP